MELGNRIKSLRLQHNLTQEELAARCELSKGFISMMENDLTSPSVSTLTDVLEVFGLSLHEFFEEPKISDDIVHYADEYFKNETDDGTIEYLISNAQTREIEPLKITLNPKGSTDEIGPHEGEMFGYVLEGNLKLVLGDKSYKIGKGDSFYYCKPTYVQRLINESTAKKAVVMWLSTPPVF